MCYSSGENVDFDGFDDEVLHWYWRPGHGLHLGRLGCTAVPTAHSRMHNAHQATIAHTHWHAGMHNCTLVGCSEVQCTTTAPSAPLLKCTSKGFEGIAPPVCAQPAAGKESMQIVFAFLEGFFQICQIVFSMDSFRLDILQKNTTHFPN